MYQNYYHYAKVWNQPVISSDGNLGGNTFATYANSVYSDASVTCSAYKAFDNNTSTFFHTQTSKITDGYLIFYNPLWLKINKITITNRLEYAWSCKQGQLLASNDNINYIPIANYTNTITDAGKVWEFEVNNKIGYKYFKFTCVSGIQTDVFCFSEMKIAAHIATPIII